MASEDLQQRLERYDIIDRIAVGGMAEVFLAKVYGAHGFEKTVAIKRILPELALDPEFEERFIAEAKVAVRLSHANVVQVFDFGRFGESLFIAMEFVDGLDLAALLRKLKEAKRQVPLPTAFHIAIEILRALDFAHQHGVVHRDVSPSNILLSRAGEVKIADFGIAVATSTHRPGQSGPRKVMGKWRYMSPEQTRGDTLDTRSDVFSAASVIFEIFTGQKLFPGEEADVISRNIAEMPIPKVSALRSGLPTRLDDILSGPLSRRPADRPMRPAIVLRALIEMSYESSIVATSLDLAETVGLVIPPPEGSTRSAIDDVIRQQLSSGGEGSVRKTAVTNAAPVGTQSTGLWVHTIGRDGMSRLEPTIVGKPRRRPTTSPPLLQPDDRPNAAPNVERTSERWGAGPTRGDSDRRTEVAAPPALDDDDDGANDATIEPLATAGSAPTAATVSQRSVTPTANRGVLRVAFRSSGRLVLAGIAAVAVAAGSWWVLRGSNLALNSLPDDAPRSSFDASVEFATLDIDSKPRGAEIIVAGVARGRTPMRVQVAAAEALPLKVQLAGYQPYVDVVNLSPGAILRVVPALVAAPAILHVDSDPAGAMVTLGGRSVGVTPLRLEDVPATAGISVIISKSGFASYEGSLGLPAGEVTKLRQTLKVAQRFGVINLAVQDSKGGVSAGRVYLAGKFLAEAPVQGLRLPVGQQLLQVKNPALSLAKSITVTVDDKTTRFYLVKYDQ